MINVGNQLVIDYCVQFKSGREEGYCLELREFGNNEIIFKNNKPIYAKIHQNYSIYEGEVNQNYQANGYGRNTYKTGEVW